MTAADLAERALEHVRVGAAESVVQGESSGLARFAGSEVHQPTLVDNMVVQLQVVRDRRSGFATTNRTDDEGLAALARRAEEAVDAAPPQEDHPGLALPDSFPDVEGFDGLTAALAPEEQARRASAAIAAAGGSDAYGFFTSAECQLAIASSTGLRATQRSSDASVLVLAAGEDRSGFAARTSWRASEVDAEGAGREALAKAERTRGAVEIEPGTYRAVLEPYAFGELLQHFAYTTFGALDLLEERSYLSGRLGQRLFDHKLTIADDALDPCQLPRAFDYEGTPKQRVQIVHEGVACGVVWDRRTAAKAGGGQTSTGHALTAAQRSFGPLATALCVEPGDAESGDDLAERVGDGIYVTRLHYLGIVNPREGVLTGMTRDGTFRIRDGRAAEPLVNLRFTVTVPDVLREVLGLTRARALVNQSDFYGEREAYSALVPGLATGSFTITGVGSRPGI